MIAFSSDWQRQRSRSLCFQAATNYPNHEGEDLTLQSLNSSFYQKTRGLRHLGTNFNHNHPIDNQQLETFDCMDPLETIGNEQRSFVVRQGEADISFRLSSSLNTPTLYIAITDSESGIYEAELTDETLPILIAAEFESIKWFYDYCYQERESNLITIDQEHALIVKKSKQMTNKNFIMKTYRVPTVKKELTQEVIVSSLLKRIRALELLVSEKNLNDIQERRMKKMEEDIEELKGSYKKNSGKKDYRFSETLKDKNISVTSNGKVCERTTSFSHSFVVLQNSLGFKSHKLSVNIVKKAQWISFGIGLLDKIQEYSYLSNYGNKESYSISTSKQVYFWKKDHSTHTLELNTGDVLLVEVNNDMIIYRKKGAEVNAVVLDIEFGEEEWKNACLFANLYQIGDSIALL